MRRAEERAFQANARDTGCCLVPAISSLDLTAIAGTLTCSTWPLEQRVVGVYTPRTRMLRVLLRLLGDRIELGAERSERLMARLAEMVPGAMERGRIRDKSTLRSAAQAELDLIEPLDVQERYAAAQRLSELAPRFQLWVNGWSSRRPRPRPRCSHDRRRPAGQAPRRSARSSSEPVDSSAWRASRPAACSRR
jgi:hypothetical protein